MKHYHIEIREDNKKIRINHSMFKREVGFVARVDPGFYKWKIVFVPGLEGEDGRFECGQYLSLFKKDLFDIHDFNSKNGIKTGK